MLQDTVLQAIQIQMGHEFTNFYTYKAFSGIADYQSLLGATKWFDAQSQEEYKHFDKFYTYISDKGHIPQLPAVVSFPPEITTIDGLFAQAVNLEQTTTQLLQTLAQICKEANDDQTYDLVLWFLKEQVEEEKTVQDLHKRCLMSLNNILIFDNELGQR